MKKIIVSLFLATLLFTFAAPQISAKDKEYEAIVKSFQTTFQAKKVFIPFMWLARFAVRVVKPAGVRSFNVTFFENPKFSLATLDQEMQFAMRDSLSADWTALMRVRSRDNQQVYAYMREDGKNVKMFVVTIDRENAAVIRATFDPEKLADFINNPRIFGISLKDTTAANSPPKTITETKSKN